MPRLRKKPGYLLHRHTNQARVRRPSDGKWFYLGKFDSPAARRKYERLTEEWIAEDFPYDGDVEELTVDQLCALYQRHARGYYRKNGEPTSEVYNIRVALRYVKSKFGEYPAADFGPKALKAVRQRMIDAGRVRTSINHIGNQPRRKDRGYRPYVQRT